MEDGGLCQKWREEDGFAGIPVAIFLGSSEVAGGSTKKDLRDRETDLFAVCGEGDLDVEQNY